MNLKRFMPALSVLALSVSLGWLAGYNFNERSVNVSIWATVTGVFMWIAVTVYDDFNH